jgi:hypothetical protein
VKTGIQLNKNIIDFFNFCFRLMACHFSLRGQRKVTKRKATPNTSPLTGTLGIILFLSARAYGLLS